MEQRHDGDKQEAAKKPTFGETLDEMRKRLGRIEMHLIDLREHLLPKRERRSK